MQLLKEDVLLSNYPVITEGLPEQQATPDKNTQVFLVNSLHTWPVVCCTEGPFYLGDGLESFICPIASPSVPGLLVPHGSSSEAAVASQTLSKVLSFTVNPMINGISVSFNFRSTTDIEVGGGPLKPVWTNTPTGCFPLWVTHLGLELEGYIRGSRWTAPAWLLFSSLS